MSSPSQPSTPKEPPTLISLHSEILLAIQTYLVDSFNSLKSLHTLGRTCRRLRDVAVDDVFWSTLFLKRFDANLLLALRSSQNTPSPELSSHSSPTESIPPIPSYREVYFRRVKALEYAQRVLLSAYPTEAELKRTGEVVKQLASMLREADRKNVDVIAKYDANHFLIEVFKSVCAQYLAQGGCPTWTLDLVESLSVMVNNDPKLFTRGASETIFDNFLLEIFHQFLEYIPDSALVASNTPPTATNTRNPPNPPHIPNQHLITAHLIHIAFRSMYIRFKYPFDPKPTIHIHINNQLLPTPHRLALETSSYHAFLAEFLPGPWEGYYGYSQALDLCDRPMTLLIELEDNYESNMSTKTVVDGIAGDAGAFRAFKGKGEDQYGPFTVTGRVVLATGKIFSRKR
ncbi:hypothetical protein HK102_001323, partial [Quaeritorhiza haematococci]